MIKMTKLFAVASLALLMNTSVSAQKNATTTLPLIPKPLEFNIAKGSFTIDESVSIVLKSTSPNLIHVSNYLKNTLADDFNIKLSENQTKGKKVVFELDSQITNIEGYILKVTSKEISIKSRRPEGAFLAVQTLRQLFPLDQKNKLEIPAVLIKDEPKFSHRGVMLDVARYYFPIPFIKKYIDVLAAYKINKFHLHLTEDSGWRIEIKKYPKLQEVGAWRDSTMLGHWSDKPKKWDRTRYGGFYTQDELKDLVKYAAERFVTIIPEVDMPGHMLAALASYPELGCKENATYNVQTTWNIEKDILCPKENTFKFVEDVLSEVMEIFPSKYIHIGGDEAPKDNWKKCNHCQNLIKTKGLKNEDELQSYFIQRVQKFVESKGRQIIGWEEIAHGGLAPNAVVMSWLGEKSAREAAQQKNDVIMSSNTYLYLDYYQTPDKRNIEPTAIGHYLPIETIYAYNPIPKGLTKEQEKHILGVQAHVWSEYISTGPHAEFMTFPRVLALAETAWLPKEAKDYTDFYRRLKLTTKFLDQKKVNYSKFFLDNY